MAVTPPRYAHDCVTCTRLGALDEYDVYRCVSGRTDCLIARYGNEPHENKSADVEAVRHNLECMSAESILFRAYVRFIEGSC